MEGKKNTDVNYWSKIQTSPIFHSWCGLAFERTCLLHSEQIKKALGISGMITNECSCRTSATDDHPGAQYGLLCLSLLRLGIRDSSICVISNKFEKEPKKSNWRNLFGG